MKMGTMKRLNMALAKEEDHLNGMEKEILRGLRGGTDLL